MEQELYQLSMLLYSRIYLSLSSGTGFAFDTALIASTCGISTEAEDLEPESILFTFIDCTNRAGGAVFGRKWLRLM